MSQDLLDPDPPVAEAPTRSRLRRNVRWSALGLGAVFLTVVSFSFARTLGKNPALVPSPLLGKQAPALLVAPLDTASKGTAVPTTRTGSVEVVNFYASWCVPCEAEAPYLESFYHRWAPQGVHMVGVLYADTPSAAAVFDARYHVDYPSYQDANGRTALAYGVSGSPETFVIGPDGRVLVHVVGSVGPSTLDHIMQLVSSGSTPFSTSNSDHEQAPK
jgi:cytochrome c biogenesis protein CcmG/thiol:disulfide interchange protein DsbE